MSGTLVPDWFARAKELGLSDEKIRDEVRAFCQRAEAHKARVQGLPAPETLPDESWVVTMHEAYEGGVSGERGRGVRGSGYP